METSASSPTLCMPETPQVDGGDPERGDGGRNSLASGECIVMRKRASSPFSNQGLSHRRCTVNYRSGVNSCDVTQYPIVLCVRECYTAWLSSCVVSFSACSCVCSSSLSPSHQQSDMYSHGRPACSRQDIHCQETGSLSAMDWPTHQRYTIPVSCVVL